MNGFLFMESSKMKMGQQNVPRRNHQTPSINKSGKTIALLRIVYYAPTWDGAIATTCASSSRFLL